MHFHLVGKASKNRERALDVCLGSDKLFFFVSTTIVGECK